jgi:hypothetical protein
MLLGRDKSESHTAADNAVATEGSAAVNVGYVRQPFQREPNFGVTSVNYNIGTLIANVRERGEL